MKKDKKPQINLLIFLLIGIVLILVPFLRFSKISHMGLMNKDYNRGENKLNISEDSIILGSENIPHTYSTYFGDSGYD